MDKPEAATVQQKKPMPSKIYFLYEKIQRFDNIKQKKQIKHANVKASSTSSVTETKDQKTHAYFIALTVGEGRGQIKILNLQ